jgi:hypothetical protein
VRKPKWIRGEALRTVLGLKVLQVGDELMAIKPALDLKGWPGVRKTIVRVITQENELHVDCRCMHCPPHDRAYCPIGYEHIRAWRRPLVDK